MLSAAIAYYRSPDHIVDSIFGHCSLISNETQTTETNMVIKRMLENKIIWMYIETYEMSSKSFSLPPFVFIFPRLSLQFAFYFKMTICGEEAWFQRTASTAEMPIIFKSACRCPKRRERRTNNNSP